MTINLLITGGGGRGEMNSMPTITGIWDDFVEFVMRLCCFALDSINAILRWILAVIERCQRGDTEKVKW